MKATRIIAAIVCVLSIAACQKKTADPFRSAVESALKAQNPGMESFSFYTFRVTDSVTLSQELDRREKLFMTKSKAEASAVMKYDAERKPKTKQVHMERLTATNAILKRIVAYRESGSFNADSLIYYVVSFSGAGKMPGGKVETGEMSATVSADCKVYGFQPAGANPNKGMGQAIPGYREKILAADFELEEE